MNPAAQPMLFVSYDSTISSANVALLHLLRWLHANGKAVSFAAPNDGPVAELLRRAGVAVQVRPRLVADAGARDLRDLCREHDVVVANTLAAWRVVDAAHDERRSCIWWLHDRPREPHLTEARAALAAADVLIAPTADVANSLTGLTAATPQVLPYGISATTAPPPAHASRTTNFVTLGSFQPRGGQDVLLGAISRLPSDVLARASFIIVGRDLDPTFTTKLRAGAAPFPAIAISKAVTHREALQAIVTADVIVFPAREKPMPITLIEAMSFGRVLISTRTAGVQESLHDGLNALLVEPGSATQLAEAIDRCVHDSALIAEFGQTARRTFDRRFSIEQTASAFEKLVEPLALRSGRGSRKRERSYGDWLKLYGETPERLGRLRRRVRTLRRHPRISVLMPVFNPDLGLLDEAIRSVREQVYDEWELCIADDASRDIDVRRFLERAAASDQRIKIVFRETNGHIAAASNSALGLATGEWCALLDQDDVLSPEALATVVCEINSYPEAGIFYSDEDKLDEAGQHSSPYFKTDWNPELFLAQNFINHLGVYRTELVRTIGGFREGFEGSQDYDLALRCIEQLQPSQIRHIPRVLYHWRTVAGSVAAALHAKPYATKAARRALAEHVKRRVVKATVTAARDNAEAHRVIYGTAADAPLVSVVIPTRNGVDLLRQCVRGLREVTSYSPLEIIIVDNGSTDAETLQFVRRFATEENSRVVLDPAPFNFSRLINRGAAAAHGELLLLLNNDIEIDEPDWLREMVSHVVRSENGAVGARLWFPDGTLQHGGVVVGLGGVAGHSSYGVSRGDPGYFGRAVLQQNCTAVTGACLLVRKQVFDEVGGFDEANLGINFNDIDFCLELRRRGYRNVWTPYANLIHHESASRGHQSTPEQQEQFLREANFMQRKWGEMLLVDPYYNPNLSLNWPGFSLAFPPRISAIDATATPT